MTFQPDDLDGDPSIPKGQPFVPSADQVAIMKWMFDTKSAFRKEPRLAHGIDDFAPVAQLRDEINALWDAVKPILDYRAEDTANLDDFMACHHVMTILNQVKMKLEMIRK